ncbi:hypothetical protein [Burkholderia ubonensis]|uniref:Uncharacterized protein n=1 Tax=Burkholderia ubonensis TaxID=101571 RepID=A0ABD4E8U7_9BURK|nr:hypothetical protein [Burkholderia ubonensis]KVN91186.1 hypothetical protein WJ68_35435 [Burkholderia ubonensis]
MSRSGYSDDCGGWPLIRWRGAVNAAIKGARGQAFLRELAAALDAMPEKRLIANELRSADGEFCTLGVLGAVRGIEMSKLDPDDRDSVAAAFGIAPALAAEIVFENDDACWYDEKPEARWGRMRQWVESNLKDEDHAK